ncbi:MAG: TIGR03619 family F420-dependent LLM class oxidoreductase [Chloroflexi bacterium]|nr:TIGR03619 family F420-dependent LLM class oxidoreductase [Chloroflexota bacterium]
MKFGLILPNFGAIAGGDAIRQSAVLAEDMGFDSVWTTDHVLMPSSMPDPYGNLVESLIALSIAATVTQRVQLGTSIIVTPQREPVLLAKQLASIDAVSGGRLILGAGVGWLEQEFNYLNANYGNRGARFDEGLALARTLWSGEGSFHGKFTAFDDALFSPYPIKRGDLPIWIGGNSEHAIRRAATMADGWHPVGLTPSELADGCAKLRSQANGRAVTVSLRTNIELLAAGETSRGYQAPGHAPQGSAADITSELRAYEDAGLEHAVLWLFHESWNALESRVRLFATDVMPNFR